MKKKETKINRIEKKVFALIFTAVLFVSCFSGVSLNARAENHITVNPAIETEVTTKVGLNYDVRLSDLFSDSEGHKMTYSIGGGEFGNFVKITDTGIFTFSMSEEGVYRPIVTATCSDGEKAAVSFRFTVEAAADGRKEQYDYDESNAESVTVYVTISNDGIPLMGNDPDGTILLHKEITVPYFDLAEYGMEDFYRYHTENGSGGYVDANTVRRPTALHLYIYLLEKYYMGVPDAFCGTGVRNPLDYDEPTEVRYMSGDVAYESDNLSALYITGSATSLYMANFWGHDENLMYYRNHLYPLMSPGWGSTCDYILLKDGDTIDLAMYTDWGFYTHGAFNSFDKDTYEVDQGEIFKFTAFRYDTQSVSDGGNEDFTPMDILDVALYDDEFNLIEQISGVNGQYSTSIQFPGTYYILGTDPEAGTRSACFSPATAKVIVREKELIKGDLDGSGSVDRQDAKLLIDILKKDTSGLSSKMKNYYDINKDGRLNIRDAALLLAYIAGAAAKLP